MKMKILLFYLVLVSNLNAQKADSTKTKKDYVSISAIAGLNGLGASFNLKLNSHLQLRLEYRNSELKAQTETKFGKDNVVLNVDSKIGGYSGILEIYPSKKSSFHFLGGATLSTNLFKGIATPKDSQYFGSIGFSGSEVGSITFELKGNEILPVVGIGFGRAVPKRRLGLTLDMGAAYMGQLKAKLTGSGSLEPTANEQNADVITKAFSTINWYPYINLKLNIKLF
jgi:hypothetical protein